MSSSSDQEQEEQSRNHAEEDNNSEVSNDKESHGEISGSEGNKEREEQREGEGEEEEDEGRPAGMEEEEGEEEEGGQRGKTEEELQKEELTKEIFGDSDAEDDFNVPKPQEYNDSEDDDYEETSKKLKRLKKREREEESGEERGEKKKKKKSKKKKREEKEPSKRRKKKDSSDEEAVIEEKGNEEEPEEEREEQEQERDNNNDDDDEGGNERRTSYKKGGVSDLPDFDAALERIKKRRPKKPKDDELEPIIEDFIAKMNQAAELDIQANTKKEPATHKIQHLSEVVRTLSRTYYFEKFLAAGGLSAIRRWLDRLPDGSLPNLNIREQLLAILQKLPVSTEHLQESGVGKVVMGLWKAEIETKANKKVCAQLIEKWSRPIFKLSSRYEDLESIEADLPARRAAKKNEEESQFELATKNSLRVTSSRIHAAIPEKVAMDFRRRPTASDLKVDTPNVKNPHVLAASADKLIKKKLYKGKINYGGKVQRAERMSIEGRGVK